jgi:predicted metal-dependent hydrolase
LANHDRAPLIGGGKPRVGEGQMRRVALAGHVVDYRLVRARRRSIGMHIGLDGLTVRVPRWATLREIEESLTEHARWIVRTLDAWRARRRETLPRTWISGAPIVYQGRELALALFPSRERAISVDMLNLTVRYPVPHEEHDIATFVGHWLRDETLRYALPRVVAYAAQIAPAPPPVKLSNARSEWGSCNHRGELRLSWKLAQLPPTLADYVIAHETAHLVELNHSRRFWRLVAGLYPDWPAARERLELAGAALPILRTERSMP